MTTYRIEFGKVGDTSPVPPITLPFDEINEFCRAVAEHAIPHLRPVLTEMGRPELADCMFHLNKDRTMGQFLWISLAAGKGAQFCPARLTAVANTAYCTGDRCTDCTPADECCEATCGCCPRVDEHDHCRLAPGAEDDSQYCDQHGEGSLNGRSPEAELRYQLLRDA